MLCRLKSGVCVSGVSGAVCRRARMMSNLASEIIESKSEKVGQKKVAVVLHGMLGKGLCFQHTWCIFFNNI